MPLTIQKILYNLSWIFSFNQFWILNVDFMIIDLILLDKSAVTEKANDLK